MQFNFNKLETGAKISLISLATALASLFLPWMDFMGRSQNAFLEGEFIISLPLLYPLIVLILGKSLKVFPGILSVVISLILGAVLLNIYVMDRNLDPEFGLYVFLITTFGALYGLVRWSLPSSTGDNK